MIHDNTIPELKDADVQLTNQREDKVLAWITLASFIILFYVGCSPNEPINISKSDKLVIEMKEDGK